MKPLLSICCTSFNHDEFLEKAIDSFLKQKINFPIEIIIHDDASTDKSVDIIKDYASKDNRIVTILQTENQYSQNIKPLTHFLIPKAKGKYIAICEGDDYWTDPLKLQKQVDYLEKNPEYVVSWTDFEVLKNGVMMNSDFSFETDKTIVPIDFNNLFTPYSTHTLTVVFKKEALDIPLYNTLIYSKDNSLYVMLLQKGKGIFMNFKSAVYRIHEGGVYSLKSELFKYYSSYLNIKEVTDLVPESQTSNINTVLNNLERGVAFEALKVKYSGGKLSQSDTSFMVNYFKKSSFKIKFKKLRKVIKYRILKQAFKK